MSRNLRKLCIKHFSILYFYRALREENVRGLFAARVYIYIFECLTKTQNGRFYFPIYLSAPVLIYIYILYRCYSIVTRVSKRIIIIDEFVIIFYWYTTAYIAFSLFLLIFELKRFMQPNHLWFLKSKKKKKNRLVSIII